MVFFLYSAVASATVTASNGPVLCGVGRVSGRLDKAQILEAIRVALPTGAFLTACQIVVEIVRSSHRNNWTQQSFLLNPALRHAHRIQSRNRKRLLFSGKRFHRRCRPELHTLNAVLC